MYKTGTIGHFIGYLIGQFVERRQKVKNFLPQTLSGSYDTSAYFCGFLRLRETMLNLKSEQHFNSTAVPADLIKAAIILARYDPEEEKRDEGGCGGSGLSIKLKKCREYNVSTGVLGCKRYNGKASLTLTIIENGETVLWCELSAEKSLAGFFRRLLKTEESVTGYIHEGKWINFILASASALEREQKAPSTPLLPDNRAKNNRPFLIA